MYIIHETQKDSKVVSTFDVNSPLPMKLANFLSRCWKYNKQIYCHVNMYKENLQMENLFFFWKSGIKHSTHSAIASINTVKLMWFLKLLSFIITPIHNVCTRIIWKWFTRDDPQCFIYVLKFVRSSSYFLLQ